MSCLQKKRTVSRHDLSVIPVSAIIGMGIWLAAVLWLRVGPLDLVWAKLLLMLSPLVLVPIGMRLAMDKTTHPLRRCVGAAQLPAAIALAASLLVLEQGWTAAALAIPWFAVTLLIALLGVMDIWQNWSTAPLPRMSIDAGLVYLAVGGGWAVFDRAGFRPLDFEPVIVLLTAIHFHFAGFVLPIASGLAASKQRSAIGTLACIGVVVGMPLVAVGITATQLGLSPGLEAAAAIWMALAGLLTAGLHWHAAARGLASRPACCLWGVAGTALAASMAMAAMYGLRGLLDWSWLDIPLMRATHGTLAALGFALPVFLGWLWDGASNWAKRLI